MNESEKLELTLETACSLTQSLTEMPYVKYVRTVFEMQDKAKVLGLTAQKILDVVIEAAERQRRQKGLNTLS